MSASYRVILAQESVGGGTSLELPDVEEARRLLRPISMEVS
jgi:hypothetical protein